MRERIIDARAITAYSGGNGVDEHLGHDEISKSKCGTPRRCRESLTRVEITSILEPRRLARPKKCSNYQIESLLRGESQV